MRKLTDYFLLYLKGMAMGAADIVPGVSGGTIALIAGIYEELINTIASINLNTLKTLRQDGLKAAWKQANATFLLVLLAGIGTSILSLASLIRYLLDNQPLFIWSFFFGLVIACVWVLLRQIPKWGPGTILAALIGLGLAVWISLTPPMETSQIGLGYVFFSGMLTICAMILPGISGSFILVLLGSYGFILDAIHDFKLITLAVFMAGAVIGLLVFSRILKWLLAHFHNLTLALLTGFVAGSLVKIWPWSSNYSQTGILNTFLYPVILAILGAAVVLGLEVIGNLRKTHD